MSLPLMPRYLSGGLLIVALGLLVSQLLQTNLWQVAWVAAALAVMWLVGLWQNRTALASPCFMGLCLINGLGVLAQQSGAYGLLCQALLLGSWDLNYLSTRVELLVESADMERFIVQHLRRLAIVLGLGLALAWAPLQMQLSLPLVPSLVIGFAGVFALYWFIGGLKKLNSGT